MKCKSIRFVFVLLTAILVGISGIAVNAYTTDYDFGLFAEQTVEYKIKNSGHDNNQDFINGYLTENAGVGETEWYALCMSRNTTLDFTSYINALENTVNNNLKSTDKQRIAIAYSTLGGSNLDIGAIIDETWDKLGIMSEIYALILINSGDFKCNTDSYVIATDIISKQLSDGGWALNGKYSDSDVTAMALQALSPYISDSDFSDAINNGIERLSNLQQNSGGYKSYGTENSESSAQVILALCQLGIDPQTDNRFIKSGNTVIDALMTFKCESGGFSHILNGGENNIATVQAYEAFTALNSFYTTGNGLYNLTAKEKNNISDITTNTQNENNIISSNNSPTINTNTTTANSGNQNNVSSSSNNTSSKDTNSDNAAVNSVESSNSIANDSETSTTQSIVTTISVSESTNSSETQTTTVITIATSSTASKNKQTTSESKQTDDVSVQTNGENNNDASGDSSNNWRTYAYIVVSGLFVVSQLYFIARKQFSIKRLIVSALACTICIGAVRFINIQTPEEYYSRNISDIQPDSLTVTLTVSCEVIKDEIDTSDYLIIPQTELVLVNGDTVFDILERTLAYNKIPLDYTGTSISDVYIKGINNIYEMEYGEMSGWMYRVNGVFPNESCGSYKPKDGDNIEFLYTCNIGQDIGMEEYSE